MLAYFIILGIIANPPTKFEYVLEAEIALTSDQPHLAIQALEKALETDSEDIDILAALATLYFQAQKFERAEELFATLLQFDPYDDESRILYTKTLGHQHKIEEAMGEQRKLEKRHPELTELVALRKNLESNSLAPTYPRTWTPFTAIRATTGFDSNYGLLPSLTSVNSLGFHQAIPMTLEFTGGISVRGFRDSTALFGYISTQHSAQNFSVFEEIMPNTLGLIGTTQWSLGTVSLAGIFGFEELFTKHFTKHYQRSTWLEAAVEYHVQTKTKLFTKIQSSLRKAVDRPLDPLFDFSVGYEQMLSPCTLTLESYFKQSFGQSADSTVLSYADSGYQELGARLGLKTKLPFNLNNHTRVEYSAKTFDVELDEALWGLEDRLNWEKDWGTLFLTYRFTINYSAHETRDYERHQIQAGIQLWYTM
ncbi:MAG: tetratricopeptide repeat protein [Myxococcota bacterium]|nr:tetratricopeptide repeat protein [Myxococcota bacterium]